MNTEITTVADKVFVEQQMRKSQMININMPYFLVWEKELNHIDFRMICFFLALSEGKYKQVKISKNFMRIYLGMSKQGVQNSIDRLIEKKHIAIAKKGGGHNQEANTYEISDFIWNLSKGI